MAVASDKLCDFSYMKGLSGTNHPSLINASEKYQPFWKSSGGLWNIKKVVECEIATKEGRIY